MIDTHCHVQFNAYKGESDEVIQRSLDKDVQMITIGTQSTTSQRAIEFAERYDGVWAAVGLHPIHLMSQHVDEEEIEFKTREEKFDYELYKKLASHPKVVAIGETGFDFYHVEEGTDFEQETVKQKENAAIQIDLATELELPFIAHCRDAHQQMIELLDEKIRKGKLSKRGVIHSFTEGLDVAKPYLEMGFVFSFNGIITFPPKKALAEQHARLIECVRQLPLESILIETDAPYLSPVPLRGKRNEPWHVRYVAEKVAELKGISIDEVNEVTTSTAKRIFNL